MLTPTTGHPPPATDAGFLRKVLDRFEHLIHEVGKFGVVGAITFLVDFSLFNLFDEILGFETLTAKTISTAVAATLAFIGNRYWTWRHRERSGLGREYGLYFLFNAVGLAIGLACLGICYYGLGSIWPVFQTVLAKNISGILIGTALGSLFRFWAYRRFVFVAAPVATPTVTLHQPPSPERGVTHPDDAAGWRAP